MLVYPPNDEYITYTIIALTSINMLMNRELWAAPYYPIAIVFDENSCHDLCQFGLIYLALWLNCVCVCDEGLVT